VGLAEMWERWGDKGVWGGEGEELEMKWVGKMFCGFMMLKFCGSSERVWVGRMVCVGGGIVIR